MESIVANIMSLVVGFGIALLFISFINLYLLIDLMAALKKLRDKHRDKNDNDQSNDNEGENNRPRGRGRLKEK